MKKLTLLFGLLLALSQSCSHETKVDGKTATQSGDSAYVTDEKGKTIEMEEDTEYQTTDGDEVKFDKDPIGDDQIEVDD